MELQYIIIGSILLTVLVILELVYPARTYDQPIRIRSYRTNTFLFLFNNLIFFGANITLIYGIVYEKSIMHILDSVGSAWQFVLGILILDFVTWVWHMLNHRINFLWRFHKCHHAERYLNVTSAVRFHIGELILSVFFKSLVLFVLGIPFWVFVLYESLITLFAMFHHANISLPRAVQKVVQHIIVTPQFHRTHHSSVRSEHDSNYGVIFVWWDYIFATYKKVVPRMIGLEGVSEKGFVRTLFLPFAFGRKKR